MSGREVLVEYDDDELDEHDDESFTSDSDGGGVGRSRLRMNEGD